MTPRASTSSARNGRRARNKRHRLRRAVFGVAALTSGAVLTLAGGVGSALADPPSQPPPVTVLSSHGAAGRGDIFITPTGDTTTYAQGAEILNRDGHVIWFHAAPEGLTAADFRTQRYEGHRILTFWQRTQRGRSRVPHHAVEHGPDPGLHDRQGEPHLDRRLGSSDRDQRRGSGG
jgi:hypothetical protein